ncbi:MAG: NYN domain-containing protein [Pyrinomonadaceae bacterium]
MKVVEVEHSRPETRTSGRSWFGFEVVVHDRNVANKEKKVDANIVTDIVADSYELMTPGEDEITLVAGDADYVPMIEKLRARGFTFHVVFWDHASRELKDAASKFISLNPFLEHLKL